MSNKPQFSVIKGMLQLAIVSSLFLAVPVYADSYDDDSYNDEYDQPTEEFNPVSDPFESANRTVYQFNRWFNKLVLRPVTKTYRAITPKPLRKMVHNALDNIKEPITMANALLQGDFGYATTSLGRFMLNSTFGIGGLYKFVKTTDNRKEDFGQTLGHYGIGSGPYLMLPILGPSNFRDGIGLAADTFSDPLNYTLSSEERLIKFTISGIDDYEALMDTIDEIELTSLDPYAAYRSMYSQFRVNQIHNGSSK